jgi:hypothetical protein
MADYATWLGVQVANKDDMIRLQREEINRLRADMTQIERIANIPPADDSFGSLAVRMGKVWLLASANSVKGETT